MMENLVVRLGPRSEGPAVNSPVREGGGDPSFGAWSAEGAPRFVPALRASGKGKGQFPALTDGAIDCRSFGPGAAGPESEA